MDHLINRDKIVLQVEVAQAGETLVEEHHQIMVAIGMGILQKGRTMMVKQEARLYVLFLRTSVVLLLAKVW